MIISFAGHSCITASAEVKEKVKEQMRKCIASTERVTCYLGGYGDFDNICAVACNELKRENSNIEIVFVTPYLKCTQNTKSNNKNIGVCVYDSSVYPPIENVPLKFAILKRNEWMIEKANLVIAYVKYTYGGAYKTLQIAKRKKKDVINIADLI